MVTDPKHSRWLSIAKGPSSNYDAFAALAIETGTAVKVKRLKRIATGASIGSGFP